MINVTFVKEKLLLLLTETCNLLLCLINDNEYNNKPS